MDDHKRNLNTRISDKEAEPNVLFTKIQKLEEEISTLHHKKLISKGGETKAGKSRNVINRRPRSDLRSGERGGGER